MCVCVDNQVHVCVCNQVHVSLGLTKYGTISIVKNNATWSLFSLKQHMVDKLCNANNRLYQCSKFLLSSLPKLGSLCFVEGKPLQSVLCR